MTSLIDTTANRPAATTPITAHRTWSLRALLSFLQERDRRYRDARKLARMSDDRLKDMGISRAKANSSFYQARGNRPADDASIPLQWGC